MSIRFLMVECDFHIFAFFRATIVKGPKDIYWMDVKSNQISFATGNATVTSGTNKNAIEESSRKATWGTNKAKTHGTYQWKQLKQQLRLKANKP